MNKTKIFYKQEYSVILFNMLKTNILSKTLSGTTKFYYEYNPGIILTMNDTNQKVSKNILSITFVLNIREQSHLKCGN